VTRHHQDNEPNPEVKLPFNDKDFVFLAKRIEELRQDYHYSGEQLLLGLPELLWGDLLLWYCNNKASWFFWEDFDKAFCSQFPDAKIPRATNPGHPRPVQPGEFFNKYATVLLMSMRRILDRCTSRAVLRT